MMKTGNHLTKEQQTTSVVAVRLLIAKNAPRLVLVLGY